jgi:hypothetical protein
MGIVYTKQNKCQMRFPHHGNRAEKIFCPRAKIFFCADFMKQGVDKVDNKPSKVILY